MYLCGMELISFQNRPVRNRPLLADQFVADHFHNNLFYTKPLSW